MRHAGRLAILALAGVMLAGACSGETATVVEAEPPSVTEPSDEAGLTRITLSSSAAHRLGIEIDAVAETAIEGTARKVMPYGALIYHPDGTTWAYTNPEDLVYIRAPLTVDRVDGDRVLLRSGPSAGTAVVSVGAAELYGIEDGIGK